MDPRITDWTIRNATYHTIGYTPSRAFTQQEREAIADDVQSTYPGYPRENLNEMSDRDLACLWMREALQTDLALGPDEDAKYTT